MSLESFRAEMSTAFPSIAVDCDAESCAVQLYRGRYPGYIALDAVGRAISRNGLRLKRMVPPHPTPTRDGEFALWPDVYLLVVPAGCPCI